MNFDWKRWGWFGFKVSALWLVALVLLGLFGLTGLGLLTASSFSTPAWVGIAGLGIIVLIVVVALIASLEWAILGYVYEKWLEDYIGDLHDVIKFALLGTVWGSTFALLGGGLTLVGIIMSFVFYLIFGYITLWVFERLDWDVPFKG